MIGNDYFGFQLTSEGGSVTSVSCVFCEEQEDVNEDERRLSKGYDSSETRRETRRKRSMSGLSHHTQMVVPLDVWGRQPPLTPRGRPEGEAFRPVVVCFRVLWCQLCRP